MKCSQRAAGVETCEGLYITLQREGEVRHIDIH